MAYPPPAGPGAAETTAGPQRYATPLRIATEAGALSFLSTTMIFGTPSDITLSELVLETLFPAAVDTVRLIGKLAIEGFVPA